MSKKILLLLLVIVLLALIIIDTFAFVNYFKNGGTDSLKEATFPNFQKLNLDGFIGRAYSTSYIAHGVKDLKGFRKALKELFNRYQEEGTIIFTYKTTALLWRFL